MSAGAPLREGLVYVPGFLSEDEERGALALLDAMELRAVVMRGQAAKRTVRHFGLDYEYESGGLTPADPLPEGLEWLRERCAALMEREPADLAQILVSRYPPGAGIGWHRDAPMFGSKSGKARWSWQHSIPAARELRYSVTFRTLKRAPARA